MLTSSGHYKVKMEWRKVSKPYDLSYAMSTAKIYMQQQSEEKKIWCQSVEAEALDYIRQFYNHGDPPNSLFNLKLLNMAEEVTRENDVSEIA